MKHTKLYACLIAAAAVAAPLSAHAAYNVYSKDGLTLDIGGNVTAQFSKQHNRFTYTHDSARYYYDYDLEKWETAQANYDIETSDRRSRLGFERGSSWLQFRGQQRINQYLRATGTVQLGYYKNDLNLTEANVALDLRNVGSISFGKQFLHSGYVTRTGTYYPLEHFGNASIRADYTGVPELQVSAYHLFPSQDDVRKTDNVNEIQGNGISATYRLRIAPDHSIRFGAGYTQSKRNSADNVKWASKKKHAAAGSIEYKYRDFTIAGDIGYEKEKIDIATLGQARSRYYGLKAEYAFTPRFKMAAGYGVKNTKKTAGSLGAFNTNAAWNQPNFIAANEEYVVPKIKRRKAYLKADYDLRENVTLYGRADVETVKNYVDDGEFSKRRHNEFTSGISLTF